MTSDDEKDPPVPANLEGAAKHIHPDQVLEEHVPYDHEALANKPNH
ncbi:hypothetical protein HWD94_19175 [Pseudarthrobacter equi]|nr:hypothetical protein [Pseudarthrobacter equi]MCT9627223.1 hypothetical protein [Pseudarthrobacter equi]